MAIILQGNGGTNADVDTDRRLFVNVRPPAFGALGYYQIAQVTGTIAASLAANAPLFSFRWGNATDLCLIQSVKVGGIQIATGTAAEFDLALFVARSFTASDSGGTSILPTSNSNKMRTSMGTTLVTDMRIATTAGLTAGTRTLDTNPIARVQGALSSATADIQVFPGVSPTPLYVRDNLDHHPLVLAQNEGFVITNPIAGPASDTFILMVQVTWGEVAAY